MAKKKDFVSDGLMTLRHKYVDDQLRVHGSKEEAEAASNDQPSLNDRKAEIFFQAKNDFEIKVHEHAAELEERIATTKYTLGKLESAEQHFEQLIKKLSKLPKAEDIQSNPEAAEELEKLRIEFFSIKAKFPAESEKPQPAAAPVNNSPQISLVPELNSINQVQMFKMGLFFALPLIFGIITGCVIIALAFIFNWG